MSNRLTFFAIFILFAVGVSQAWYNTSWGYSIPIDINTTVSNSLTSFPASVSMNTSNSTLWNTTNCANVRFIASDNTTVLNYELDSASPLFCGNATNNATFWVSYNYTGNATTRIYAYLGNVGAASGENKVAVWTGANYTTVLHGSLYTGSNGFQDSVMTNNMTSNGTISISNSSYMCKVGSCFNYLSTAAYVYNLTSTIPLGQNTSTISMWAWRNSTTISAYTFLYAMGTSATGQLRVAYYKDATTYMFDRNGGGSDSSRTMTSPAINALNYHADMWHAGAAYNDTIFINATNKTFTYSDAQATVGTILGVGGFPAANAWWGSSIPNASIDEFRLSTSPRTMDWLTAEYKQTAIIGIAESAPGAAPTNASVSFVSPTTNTTALTAQNWIAANASVATSNSTANLTIRLYNSTGAQINITSSATSPLFVNWTGLADGLYYFNATVNTTDGTFNISETRSVNISTTYPAVSFTTPTTNTSAYQTTNSITANVSASDANYGLTNITVYLYNGYSAVINSSTSTTSPLFANFTGLADGTYYWQAVAINNIGNGNSTELRQTYINTAGPAINFISPTDNDSVFLNRNSIFAAINVSSAIFNSSTIFLYQPNGTVLTANGTASNTCYQEFANQTTTCGGLANPNAYQDVGAWNDGSWTTTSGTADKWFNYTFSNAFTSATLKIAPLYSNGIDWCSSYGTGAVIYNYNISQDCLATGAAYMTLNYSAYPYGCTPGKFGNCTSSEFRIYCKNSTGMKLFIENVYGGSYGCHLTSSFYEEAITWSAGTGNNLSNNFTGLLDGLYHLNATAIDSAGLTNKTETRNITIDTINPIIQFTTPTTNTSALTANNWIYANVSATDANLHNITVVLYNSGGGIANSATGATSPIATNFTGLADGTYYMNATAFDSANNMNKTETRSFTIDTANPAIWFSAPTDNDSANSFLIYTITANATATDASLNNITIWLYDDSGNLISQQSNATAATNVYHVFSGLTGGLYHLNATASDALGHTNATETRNITIWTFAEAITSPADGSTVMNKTVPIIYTISSIYPAAETLTCDLYLDSVLAETRNTNGGTYTYSATNTADGLHTAYLTCYFISQPTFTTTTGTTTFNVNYIGNQGVVILGTSPAMAASQAMFYDINGSLNVLYFTNLSGIQRINIARINPNNTVANNYSSALSQGKAFYEIMRDNGYTSIISFGNDNLTYHYMAYNGGLSIWNISVPGKINAGANSQYNPYTYAYTKQYDTLNTTANVSYYLFYVRNGTTNSVILKRFIDNSTLEVVNRSAAGATPTWMSLAKSSDLTNWYVPIASGSNIALFSYDGTSYTKVFSDNATYSAAQLANVSVLFESYGGSNYWIITGTGITVSKIYQIETQKNITFNTQIANMSHILFVDANTFVFVSSEAGNPVYSCYFGDVAANCTKMTASQYGAILPIYTRGAMTTTKRSGITDYISYGTIATTNYTTLTYTTIIYDVKFFCYDEKAEYRKPFTSIITTTSQAIQLSNASWGYVIPSSIINGTDKRLYAFCTNSTNRLYLFGINGNFTLPVWGLNTWEGAYYTFHVIDNLLSPIAGATITATRFSTTYASYVAIEQGITDTAGHATLFLEPLYPYNIMISGPGIAPTIFTFTPSGTTAVDINVGNSLSVQLPENYEQIWSDITWGLAPINKTNKADIQIAYIVASNSSSLRSFGMVIQKTYNGTSTIVYNTTNIISPTGGALLYTTNGNGTYDVQISFKSGNYSTYSPLPAKFIVGPANTWIYQAQNTFNAGNIIGGWAYFAIALVCSLLVAGFASRFSFEASGVMAIIVMWGFALFNMGAVIFSVGVFGCTMFYATCLLTLAAGAVYVLKSVI